MEKYILFIMCFTISSGHLQQLNRIQPNGEQQNQYRHSQVYTELGTVYGGARKIQVKPCARRQNQDTADQWIPTFKSRITTPFQYNNNVVLKPQSLKDGDFHTEPNIKLDETSSNILLNRRSNDHYNFRQKEAINERSVNMESDDYIPEVEKKIRTNILQSANNETEEKHSKKNEDSFESEINQKNIEGFIRCLFIKNTSPKTKDSYTDSRRFMFDTNDLSSENRNDYALELNSTDELYESVPLIHDSPIHSPNNLSNSNNKQETDSSNLNAVKHDYDENVTKQSEILTDQSKVSKLEEIANQPMEPTKGIGISDTTVSRAMILESPRVCYACSTANNPTCWTPDKRTTVKYCGKEHDACVTKTFKTKSVVLVRDCGKSCDDSKHPGVEPKVKSCSICHSDLCNSAITVNINKLYVVILFIFVTKYTI